MLGASGRQISVPSESHTHSWGPSTVQPKTPERLAQEVQSHGVGWCETSHPGLVDVTLGHPL